MEKDFSLYEFDVVISFAEEQRDAAVAINLALEAYGLSVYYYPYDQEINIGHDLSKKLHYTYSENSLLAVALLSHEYSGKEFTQVEFNAILERLEIEEGYLVPIKMDKTEIPEKLGSVTYYHWDKDPKKLSEILVQRLHRITGGCIGIDSETIGQKTQGEIAGYISRLKGLALESFEYHYSLGLHYHYYSLVTDHFKKGLNHLERAIELNPMVIEPYVFACRCLIEKKPVMTLPHKVARKVSELLIKAHSIESDNKGMLALSEQMSKEYFQIHGLKNPLNSLKNG